MSALPKYLFVIKDSSGNLYEFEKATKRAWEWYENDVGRCRFFIPYTDLKLSTTSVPDGAYSEILIYRDNVLVWQGVVQIIQDVIDGTYVYGETFMRALDWYGVRFNQAYSAQPIGTIIDTEYVDIVARTNNFLNAKITKGTIENPYIVSTTNNLLVTQTLYNEHFLLILKQFVALARGEMTATFDQYTVFNISFHETTPTFSFLRNVGSDKSDVVFELDSELVDYNIPKDMKYIENELKGFAIAPGPVTLTSLETQAASQVSWYRRESYPYYNNITDQTALDQRVDDRGLERKDPKKDMYLKFASGLKPFDGYSMGDTIKIRINRGRTVIDEFRRVIGMEVTIEDTGVELTVPILQETLF